MNKYIIAIVLAIFTFSLVFSAEPVKKTESMSTKWKKLNKLISTEIRVIKSVKHPGPNLKYRLLELYSEKIKLIRTRENRIFLKASPVIVMKKGKDYYFRRSRTECKTVMNYGLKIIKNHPRFKEIADIYYTLALNSKEFGKDKFTEQFLLKSLKYSKNRTTTYYAQTSLAEYYYNEKKYPKAIRHYTKILKNLNDEWYSKHSYNAAWCYLKVNNPQMAIQLLKKAYYASKKSRYIDVSERVLNAIGIFHIDAKKVKSGVLFYIKNVKNPVPYFLKMAKNASAKGFLKTTRYLLKKSLAFAKATKDFEGEIEIRLMELDIYREFSKLEIFYRSSIALYLIHKVHPLTGEKQEEAVRRIRELAGFLQIKLTRNAKKNIKGYSQTDLRRVVQYFKILSLIDSDSTDQYQFYKGETYFAVGKFQDASNAYIKGLEFSKKKKERMDIKKKILHSLLATISEGRFKRNLLNKLTIYTYDNYLQIWPRGEKSQAIYKKLFNIYLSLKKLDKSSQTIERYNKNYPKDIKFHRTMQTRIIDHHVDTKDVDNLSFWINKLETGYLSFDPKYIAKALSILGSILFLKYQKLEKNNQKDDAIAGYILLYNNKKYPAKIKMESALKISKLYLDMQQTENSLLWVKNYFKVAQEKDSFKLISHFNVMAEQYYMLQDFKSSSSLYLFLISKFCSKKFKLKSNMYINSIQFMMIENDFSGAIDAYDLSEKCPIDKQTKSKAALDIISFSLTNRNYDNLFSTWQKFKSNKELVPTFKTAFINTLWDSNFKDDSGLNKKTKKMLAGFSSDDEVKSILEGLTKLEELKKHVHSFQSSGFKILPKFDETDFNQQLESKFSSLKIIIDSGTKLIRKGIPEITITTYALLADSYMHLATHISSYTPGGMLPDFVAGLKKQMKGIAAGLFKKASQHSYVARITVTNNNLFTFYNKRVTRGKNIRNEVDFDYPIHLMLIPVDTMKGGVK